MGSFIYKVFSRVRRAFTALKPKPKPKPRPKPWGGPDPAKVWPRVADIETPAIVHAFEANGVDYFQFADPGEMPVGRFLGVQLYTVEGEMKLSPEYLKTAMALLANTLEEIRTETAVDLNNREALNKAKKLIADVHARANIPFDFAAFIRLAAVVFFTPDENPMLRDESREAIKIKEWLATPGLPVFFCETPLRTLTPFFGLTDAVFIEMIRGAILDAKTHARNLLAMRSQTSTLNTSDGFWLQVLETPLE